MNVQPDEEADWLISGECHVIPVTIILVSDDDGGDEDEDFRSVKMQSLGRQQKVKAAVETSRAQRKMSGSSDARARRRGSGDPPHESRTQAPPSQPPPGRGQWQYSSDRSPRADGCSVKSEPGGTNGRGRRSPAHGGRRFTCEACDYSSHSSYNLACHARTHTGERPYGCDSCALRFRTRSGLNRHTQAQTCLKPAGGATRPAPRPKAEPRVFECASCDYSTPHSYNLKVHLRVHSDERPYRCGRCKCAFRTQSHLYRHERCHPLKVE